jgi:hypothetical protein
MCTVQYSAERHVSVVLTTYDLAIRDLALLRKQGAGSDRYLMLLALSFPSYPFLFFFLPFSIAFCVPLFLHLPTLFLNLSFPPFSFLLPVRLSIIFPYFNYS